MASTSYYQVYESPIGPLTLIEQDSKLVRVMFNRVGDDDRTKSNPYPDRKLKETPLLKKTKRQLDEYFTGNRQAFDLPLEPQGTEFQKKAWSVLRNIPYGKTVSYGDQAESLGGRKYSRAVGQANNKNPIPIIIPCHRVIGKNGQLTGYAGGLDVKMHLLELERQAV